MPPTAAWGLLHFWENHLVAGIESYQRAETLASDSLQKDLLAIDFLAMADAKDQNALGNASAFLASPLLTTRFITDPRPATPQGTPL